MVYELPGTPFPYLRWRRALGELADIRNDVAHRRDRLGRVMAGASRSADAIAEHLLDLGSLGRHVVETMEDYVANLRFVI